MKKNIFLLSIMLFLITACNNDEAEINIGKEQSPVTFTTTRGNADGVSVLIFGKEQTANEYKSPFTPKWVDGTNGDTLFYANKTLYLGKYNFLFYKWEKKGNVTTTPTALVGGTEGKVENIRFNAIPETTKPGYYKSVEMIYLPVKAESATKEYIITGEAKTLIKDSIQNAVSKVEVIIKRGIKNATGGYDEFGKDKGAREILEDVESITIDINKIGTAVGINGAYGSAKTIAENIAGKQFIPKGGTYNGFAIFDGPLVFPNDKAEKSEVEIKIKPKAGTPYKEMTVNTEGMLERDKKLEITLWLTSTYKLITVTVETKKMEEETPGDVGIWE